jgi:hypothetical protein
MDRAVIIAMSVVLMMQVTIDKVVNVVSMRNCWVPATWAVNMVLAMR